MKSINEVARANSLARAVESAQGRVGPDEAAYRRVFPRAAPPRGFCDGSDCAVCAEINRVKGGT